MLCCFSADWMNSGWMPVTCRQAVSLSSHPTPVCAVMQCFLFRASEHFQGSGDSIGVCARQTHASHTDIAQLSLVQLATDSIISVLLQVIEGITNRLGSTIWNNTFIGFTHGKLSSLPDGLSYGELCLVLSSPACALDFRWVASLGCLRPCVSV